MEKLLALYLVSAAIQMTSAKFPDFHKPPFIHTPLKDVGEPLILTPYLEQNRTEEARIAAEVHFDAFQNVTSYSGFFTVDKLSNGNLFFWFFPSANDYATDPVLLWLQGGPGVSSLFGLFAEHGPFTVVKGDVVLRNISWHRNHSVLYIDQPVGTGFSFTEGEYVTNQTQVAEHLYSALTQFFTLFSELQNNEFYVSGESYGGKYVPAIGYAIHQNNPTAAVKINIQGFLIGNGFSDPINQINYADLLYQLGLIDLVAFYTFRVNQEIAIDNIKLGIYELATTYWNLIVDTLFTYFTAIGNIYNFLKDVDDSPTDWQDFLVQDEVREAIHVGNQTYSYQNDDVYRGLYGDITKSVAPWVVKLLNNYRMLIFNGQLDIIVGYALTENYLQNLNFSAANEYKNASREIWTVGNQVAGYVKTAGNLTEVLVRNAGHMVPMDQPEFAYDLIFKFIRNKSIGN